VLLIEAIALLFTAIGTVISIITVIGSVGSTDIDRACKYLDARDRLGDSASADYEQYLTEAALRCVQKDSQKKDAFRNPWIFKALLLTVFPSSALSVYHVLDECNSTVDAIPTSAIAWMMVALFQLFLR